MEEPSCQHDKSWLTYSDLQSRYLDVFQCMDCKQVVEVFKHVCATCNGEGTVVVSEAIVDPAKYGLGLTEDGCIMKQEYINAWAAREAFFSLPWYKRWYKFAPRKPY